MRALLIAEWDAGMERWRIPGAVYAYEEALKSDAPVVISSDDLLKALVGAGLDAKQFGFGGRYYGKRLLLDGDQLTEWAHSEDSEVVSAE
ncbi:hypothetical protein CRM90_22530 [Mycobacterium sp. ENV421]|nr:hypothetical protein CRM90_22530 [Mycobacterium sp. ENV421]